MSQQGPKGQLSKHPIFKLLKWVKQKNKTGLLQLRKDEKVRNLYFKKGELFHAKSNSPKDRIGQILVQQGKITTVQYQKAVKAHLKTREKLGKVLLALKIVTEEDLFLILENQVKEIVLDCFGWFDGEFWFYVNRLPNEDVIPHSFNVDNLIKEGLKRRKAWAKLVEYLPSSNDIVITNNNVSIQDVIQQLTRDDREILLLVDGIRTFEDICSLSKYTDYKTATILYKLFDQEIITRLGEEPPKTLKTPVIEETFSDVDPLETVEETEEIITEESKEDLAKIDDLFKDIDDMNYYQMLGLETDASEENIKKSYYSMAKEYHPDRYNIESLKPKLTKIFEKIKEAHETIGDSEKKKEYDRKMGFVEDEASQRDKRQKTMAEMQFKLGQKKFGMKQYKIAIDFFQSAIDMNPEIGSYYGLLGEALGKFPQKVEEAKVKLKKAISMEPNNARWLNGLGSLFKNQGDFDRAASYYYSSLKVESENTEAIDALKTMKKPLKKETRFDGIIRKDLDTTD